MIFTPDEVNSLNEYQRAGVMHPFTCGGDRTDEKHLDGEGILVATEDGWNCPYCDYKQDWAHEFIKNWAWKNRSAGLAFELFGTSKEWAKESLATMDVEILNKKLGEQ